ncbi:MAG: sulfatase [Verrucomicrobiales bacterium]|nr:sulfatase [Verrucomicrobiales bacterium]
MTKRHSLRLLFLFSALLSLFIGMRGSTKASDLKRPNVLFIAVDDLRVELACYGSPHVISPHIDQLAREGTLFENAYCQQTVCNPSRASVLTGRRPDTLRVWDLPTHFRANSPDVITLPQYFKENGYFSQGIGKIFHNWRQDHWRGDPDSWSVPSVLHYNSHSKDKPVVAGEVPPDVSTLKLTESRDVPDDAYFDGRVAEAAVKALRELKGKKEPFFLGVGFWKPHTPFNAPKKYWDLYQPERIPLPANTLPPQDVPEIALTSDRFKGTESELREMHHGHLAAISYLDAQVGKVMEELKALNLLEETIVVFWSDHGLHLGEHGLMRKTTVFDLDARVPLIIRSAEFARRQRSDSLVELLDIYPTLTELCGLEFPKGVEGVSLVPLLEAPGRSVRQVALTQTARPNYPRGEMPEVMGYSIRSKDHRYTEWRDFASGEVVSRELYDHRRDSGETVNLAGREDVVSLVEKFSEQLQAILHEEKSGESFGTESGPVKE